MPCASPGSNVGAVPCACPRPNAGTMPCANPGSNVGAVPCACPNAGFMPSDASLKPNRRQSAWSGLGAHQFHVPSNRIVAGTSSTRMILASISTAIASPTPTSLIKMICDVENAPSTTANNKAALVIIPPVRCRPEETARWLLPVASYSSLIRLRRKTS